MKDFDLEAAEDTAASHHNIGNTYIKMHKWEDALGK